jgi:membrane protease subunit HflC
MAEKTKKKSFRGLKFIILGVCLVAFILLMSSMVVTYENEYNVIKYFDKVIDVRSTPGLTFKAPFIHSVQSLPKSQQFYDIPISTVTTSDKKQMIVDAILVWRISDVNTFLTTLRGSESEAENRLSTIAYEKMKAVISATPQTDVISNRDTLASKIYDQIGDEPQRYGCELVRLETKRLDLPDDNKEAVYTRMISERESIAAQLKSDGERDAKELRNQTDRDVSIMLSNAEAKAAEAIARGERMYMSTLAEAYSTPERAEFYAFIRSLEGMEAALKDTAKTKIIIGPDSPFMDVLNKK